MATVQNTLFVIGDTTTSTSIRPAHIAALKKCSEATGWSLSQLMNRALGNFIHDEVFVFMEAAAEQRRRVGKSSR